jgi:hypothetical protein
MKQFLLLLTLVISLNITAQSLPKDSTIEQFCILRLGWGGDLSGKVTIDLDYGQERKLWGRENILKDDKTGKPRKFNSLADGLNYLGQLGWKLVAAVPIVGDKTSSTDYIFKKEFSLASLR